MIGEMVHDRWRLRVGGGPVPETVADCDIPARSASALTAVAT